MTNVTISMDEDTARWVRVEAAKAGKSVSRYIGELLAERRRAASDTAWEAGREARKEAIAKFLASPARDMGFYGRAPKREEIYDEVLRRHERVALREGQDIAFEADPGDGVAGGAARKRRGGAKRAKPA